MIRILKSFDHLLPCPNATFQKRSVEYYLASSCPFDFIVFFDLLRVKNENDVMVKRPLVIVCATLGASIAWGIFRNKD